MASTYSTNLGIELMGTGDQSGTWGTTTNTNLGTLLEQAIAGYATQAVTDSASATVLTITNGAASTGRNPVIVLTGAITADRVVEVPAKTKLYVFKNSTTGGFNVTVKVTGQTGVTIAMGKTAYMFCNGTDTVEIFNAPVTEAGTQTLTNKTLTSPTLTSPTVNSPTISGGTINNAVIGGSTPAAVTATTVNGTTITASTQFSGPLNGTVGATTPSTGAFTTLSASSTVSGTGFTTYLASPPAIGGTTPAAGAFTTVTATTGAATAATFTSASVGAGGTIAVTDTGTNGSIIKMTGNGATTPSKFLNVLSGVFRIVNNAYSAALMTVDDSGNLTATANVTAYSDERVKTNWRSMEPGFLKQLSEIKAGTYDRTDTPEPLVQVGVSAQDLQKILGPAVLEDADGMLSVAYGNAALVAAVELCKEVQRLHTEIEALKAQFHEEIGSIKVEFADEITALKARPVCKCVS